MSYFHASWERQEDIERVDPQARMKIKRFMQAPQAKGILGTKVSYSVSVCVCMCLYGKRNIGHKGV